MRRTYGLASYSRRGGYVRRPLFVARPRPRVLAPSTRLRMRATAQRLRRRTRY